MATGAVVNEWSQRSFFIVVVHGNEEVALWSKNIPHER